MKVQKCCFPVSLWNDKKKQAMSTVIPFFDKASHQVAKLRAKYPSQPRCAAWKLAFWAAGKAFSGKITGEIYPTRSSHSDNILHLAFLLRGGIGDIILNLAWMDALVSITNCSCRATIYTNTKKSCMYTFCKNILYVDNIYTLKGNVHFSSFDAVFDIMQNPQIKSYCKERLKILSPPFMNYVQRLLTFQSSHSSFYLDENQAMGIHYADVTGSFRRGQADFDGSLNLKDSNFTLQAPLSHEDIFRRFGVPAEYLTIQREAGAYAESTKLWSASKYSVLLETLCREYPSKSVVLLGLEKNFEMPQWLEGQIIDLRGRTDFDEFMSLVRYSRLHIGCEGIVPHLRHYLRGGPSLVLFGPSCARMLGYPENIALSGTECPNGCEGILPSWQYNCLKGYNYCRSLEEITVEQVMQQVQNIL